MASGWNLWVWLQCIGMVSGWYCKEIYRFLHNISYRTPLVLALFCSCIPISLFILKMFLFFLIIRMHIIISSMFEYTFCSF